MKKKTKAVLCVFVAILISMLSLTIEYSINNFAETDIEKYGDWNNKTKAILTEDFNGLLPYGYIFQNNLKDYCYCFNQGIALDSNFVIYATFEFDNKETFASQIDIAERKTKNTLTSSNFTYLIVQGSEDDVLAFSDTEILDGYFYNFEIVIVDNESNSISYLVSRVWDYYKNPELSKLLNNIMFS